MSDLATNPAPAQAPAPAAAPVRRRRARWYRLPTLVTGLVLLAIIVVMCYAAPLVTAFNPNTQNLTQPLLGIGQAGHLLGTDQEGRDTWARLLYGAQAALPVKDTPR